MLAESTEQNNHANITELTANTLQIPRGLSEYTCDSAEYCGAYEIVRGLLFNYKRRALP